MYKYKLKEEPFSPGDVKVSKGIKSTVKDVDPETGAISWNIDYVPAFDSVFKEFDELRKIMAQLDVKVDDPIIDNIALNIKKEFNRYRTYLRKNHPEMYNQLKETDLSHHMTLGDDWGEVISVLEKYGTPDQINDYISHCKKNNIDFEYAQDFINHFNQWLDSKEIDEMSTSGGAGGYLSKYAFKLPKKQKKIKEGRSLAKISKPRFVKDKNNPNFLNVYIDYDLGPGGSSIALGKETMTGQIRRESAAKAMQLANKVAKDLEAKYNLEDIDITDLENGKVRIFAVSDDFINGIKENIGATMGPGPKASEEGVKDNYYVKKFAYKLVPKDKNGNYVQKGSGLEVKNF